MYVFRVTIFYNNAKETLNVVADNDVDARKKAIAINGVKSVKFCTIEFVCEIEE